MLHTVTLLQAATRTSTALGGAWATPGTWVGGIVPLTTDLAIIATTGISTVSLGANTTCAGVTVNAGSILTITTRRFTVNGSVNNSGTITLSTGRITQSGTGNFTNSGTVTFTGIGILTLVGSYINTGTLTLGATPVTFSGTNPAASTVDGFTTTGLITYSRAAGSTTFTGDVDGAAITLSAAGGTLNLGNSLNHNFSGIVTLTAGTLNGGSSNLNANRIGGTAWTRATACTFTAATGTITLRGLGTQTVAGTGATTFNNLTISGSGTKTLTTVPTVNGILSMEGLATATVSAAITMGTASTLQYKGSESRNTGPEFRTPYTSSNGVIIDQGMGNTVTLMATKSIVNGNLNIKSGTFDLSTFTVNRSALGGALTLQSSTVLRIGSTNTLPSNYSTHSVNVASTIEYDGTNQTVTNLNSSQTYGNLVLSGSGTKTIPATVVNIAGNFSLAGTATTTLAAATNFDGDFILGTGTNLTAGSLSHTISGNFENNGSTFTTTGSTFNFDGTLPQTIGGSTSSTFENLTLSNANGSTLNINQTVNGILNLTNGLLNTGSNTMTIGCSGSITNASATRFVNGKLAWIYCSAGSRFFPIGKGGNYRPLTLNYTTLTGTSTVTAEQIETLMPGTIPDDITPFSTRYWQISESGGSSFSYNLTLDGTDWNPTSYLKMLKGDGATNVHHGVTTPNYTNSSAFTSVGNFGLGELNYVTWLGSSNDWFTGSNWTSEVPPASTDDIRIPFPSSFYPTISGSSPGNDVTVASTGNLQLQNGANLTHENGSLLTFQSGATVTTGAGSKIVLKSDARFLNLGTSTPTLEVQRELTGVKGWRMVTSPVRADFSDVFSSPLVTQGFTGSSFPSLQPNLLWWLESDGGTSLQSWRIPTNITDSLMAGRGYFQYSFNGAGRLNLDGTASGSNYTDVLPTTMSVTGVENYNGSGTFDFNLTYTAKATTQTPSVGNDSTYFDLNALDQGWNLIGNPTASTLDWDAVGWTKTNMDNTIYVWDPSALSGIGDFLTWNGTTGTLGSGRIAPFQAFWAHATAATTLSFNNAVKTGTTGTFLRSAEAETTVSLPITLKVGDLQTTSYLSFSENGVTGPDSWDGYRLEPMSDNWLELYTNSSPLYKSPLVINHLPLLNDELTDIPLYFNTQLNDSDTKTDYTLSWDIPENWPSDWKISLQDHQSEHAISMKEHSSYSYDVVTSNKVSAMQGKMSLPQKPVRGSSESSLLRSSVLPPFSIIVSKGADIEYMAPKPQLLGNFPNPFGKTTNIRFSLPQKAKVHIEVFSAQGQKIAVLANGDYPAGITEVLWDASSNAPGLYFIRFYTGNSAETKKAILIH